MQKTKNDLEMDFIILDKWFHENHMVLNLGRCQYIVIDDDGSSHQIISINNKTASSNEYNFLGILLDKKLNLILIFIYLSLYKKAGQKLSALARINHYLIPDQKILLLNSVVKYQLSYCPQIWIFTSRYLNNAFNRIHKRALCLTYNNYELLFDKILVDSKQKRIHQEVLSH